MPAKQRLSLRQVRALKPGEIVWDAAVPGFGARRQRSSAVSCVLFYRTSEGRQRWFTIGRHGAPWTPDTARVEARRVLGDVANKADPAADRRSARRAQTVADLCDLYLADAEAGRFVTRQGSPKKATTLATDRGRIQRHIKPLLGHRLVSAVTRDDVEAFMHDVATGKTAGTIKTEKKRGVAKVRGGRGTASRTVALLSGIFTYAVRYRMRTDNPVHGVVRFATGCRDRRLSDAEYNSLASGLQAAEAANIWPAAVAAVRFLLLTGWRRGEVLALRWDELDIPRRSVTLRDTKTGRSIRALSHAACEVLRNLTRSGNLVFPATRGERRMSGFPKLWARIAKLGELPADVTPHTLRHSFASLAGDLGYSETTIAALIGHKGRSITSRYVHSADAVLLAAADMIAKHIAQLMGDRTFEAQVIPLRA